MKTIKFLILFVCLGTISFSQNVTIGTQVWMTKNLDVSKFRNGDPIPEAKTNEEWENAGKNKQPAWCYYNNDPKNGEKYGKLYNWYAVIDPRGLAPNGYHIPSREEWQTLIKSSGKDGYDAANKLKSKTGWFGETGYSGKPIKNGIDTYGFSAMPAGTRKSDGKFYDINSRTFFWTCCLANQSNVYKAEFRYDEGIAYVNTINDFIYYGEGTIGISLRLVYGEILNSDIKKSSTISTSNQVSTENGNTNLKTTTSQNDIQTKVYSDAVFWGKILFDKREGYGTIQYDDMQIYEGNWANDKQNGFGIYYFSNGDRYEGNWINGIRSGQGTYFFNNGDRFVGTFADGKITENGTYSYKVDKKGCVSGDCTNGFGKKVFTNAVYEGNFKNGKENGQGKMIYWSKSVYEGSFLDGQKQGKGKYSWANGDVFEGDWINGKRTGNGIVIWGKGNTEGDKYEGAWYDDKRTGFGKYTNVRTGEIKEGNFVDGVFQGSQSITQSDIPKIQSLSSGNSSTVTETSDKSSQNCTYKFTKPTNLTYKYIDNRKTCCYCRERYAIYELKTNVVNEEQALYLAEKLYSHFESENVDSEHKEYDLKRFAKFLQTTYPGYENLGIAVGVPLMMSYVIPMYSLYGRELGSTVRETDKYTIKSKFCSPKCENDCKYYGCSSCDY